VALPPGKQVTALANGTLTALRAAAPLAFAGGSPRSELTEKPERAPFAGSKENMRSRREPGRVAAEKNIDRSRREKIKDKAKGNNGNGNGNNGNGNNGNGNGNSGVDPLPDEDEDDDDSDDLTAGLIRTRQVPTDVSSVGTNVARGSDVARDAILGLDLSAADAHFNEANRGTGSSSGFGVAVVGALGDGGTQVLGGLLHGYATRGQYYFDVELLPLRVSTRSGGIRTTEDYSAVSSASVTYRERRGEVQAGRQRFLGGPTQVALYGSMVRQGSREIMDAIRVEPNIGAGQTLEVAYLIDAFPRNLPFRVSGRQGGFYGRYARRKKNLNLGLNLLKYTNAGVPDTLGATLDFALPVWKDKVEFYGELGRDPFNRRLTTFGLSFPGLYEKTDFDVYLEYARLQASGTAGRPPIELALRVYRKINKNADLVMALSRFYGTDTSFTVGLSLGAGTDRD
jgi:hypothetical protein